jgi:hypothetical protein
MILLIIWARISYQRPAKMSTNALKDAQGLPLYPLEVYRARPGR